MIQKAGSGAEAEAYLHEHPDCAVVVADLRMPGMDGLTLLERVRVIAPDAVRIVVTANADVHSAIDAINRTSIFCLLTKPCRGEVLCTAVRDALRQYRLLRAERQLLEDTLRGSVQVLVEILTLIDPASSSRALRVHRYVRHVVRILSLPESWALEVAAMLSHLGSLTLASTDHSTPAASAAERAHEVATAGDRQASAGYELLKHIPRLETVAAIIARQADPVDPADAQVAVGDRDAVLRGGQILRVAIAFDAAIVDGAGRREALEQMRRHPGDFDPAIVSALDNVELPERTFEARIETLADFQVGMILDEDLRYPHGLLMMAKGQEITRPVLLRLKSFVSGDPRKAVRVLAPRA